VLGSALTNQSQFEGLSPVVGELVVLALRWLTPVHVICSVLQVKLKDSPLIHTSSAFRVQYNSFHQAVNLSKAVMELEPMSLFWVAKY